MTTRVSADDLEFAAAWLEAYEAEDGVDENGERAERVALWLRREVARRRSR